MSSSNPQVPRSLGAQMLAQMWAKTGPNGSWHQLAYHLLHVAAVAQVLLDRHVPQAIRRRHGDRLGLSVNDFDAWCVCLAALPDFGKATPPFQSKFGTQMAVLKRLGLRFPSIPTSRPHGQMTAGPETRDRLSNWGLPCVVPVELASRRRRRTWPAERSGRQRTNSWHNLCRGLIILYEREGAGCLAPFIPLGASLPFSRPDANNHRSREVLVPF